jgi:hypothetical protein
MKKKEQEGRKIGKGKLQINADQRGWEKNEK